MKIYKVLDTFGRHSYVAGQTALAERTGYRAGYNRILLVTHHADAEILAWRYIKATCRWNLCRGGWSNCPARAYGSNMQVVMGRRTNGRMSVWFSLVVDNKLVRHFRQHRLSSPDRLSCRPLS